MNNLNLDEIRHLAGMQDINYTLRNLHENGTIESSHEIHKELDGKIGPFFMEDGSIKYYNTETKKVDVVETDVVEETTEEVVEEKTIPELDKGEEETDLDTNTAKELKSSDNKKDDSEKDKSIDDADFVKFPSEIKTSITKRITEVKKSIEEFSEKKYIANHGDILPNVIEELENIMKELKLQNRGGFVRAQLILLKLMSPITNLFPQKLIIFLAKDIS